MTTFTMQDLNRNNINDIPTAEEEEAMKTLFEQMGKDLTQPDPTPQDAVNNIAIPQAPEPQPSAEVLHNPDIPTIINNICAQLQLLSSVISSSATKPHAEDQSNQSLQECVSLTLQQADWFKDLIRRELIGGGIEDLAKDAVQEVVENEVEHYFNHQFSPEDHFDFGDAVSDAVDDRLDDIVADKIDDVVQEKFDEFIENATFKLER